jgi:hypothetical protein
VVANEAVAVGAMVTISVGVVGLSLLEQFSTSAVGVAKLLLSDAPTIVPWVFTRAVNLCANFWIGLRRFICEVMENTYLAKGCKGLLGEGLAAFWSPLGISPLVASVWPRL